MSPQIATTVCLIGIFGLFVLDRDREARTSVALWLPVAWLAIIASRELSRWLAVFGIAQATGEDHLNGSPIDTLFFTLVLVLGVAVLMRRGPAVARILQGNVPVLLFFLYCALSVSWSDYPDIAFKRWLKAVGDVVMVMIVLTDGNPSAALKRVLSRVSFVLIPLSVLFIKYFPLIGKAFKHYGVADYFGVTTNKNLLGLTCMVFGLASLWRFLSAYGDRENPNRGRSLLAHGALLAMVLWLLIAARSTTGMACVLLGSSLIVVTSFPAVLRRMWIVHSMIFFEVCACFSVLFLNVSQSAFDALGKDPTLTGRTNIWRLVLSLTSNPLVGTGFESFWLGPRLDKIYSAYWWHPNEAHNGYIEVYLNLGWVGLALLATLLIAGYRRVILGLRKDPDTGRLMLAYCVVAVVYNFTEAGFRMLDPVWVSFLFAIMSIPGIFLQSQTVDVPPPEVFNRQPVPSLEKVRPALSPSRVGSHSWAQRTGNIR